MSENDLNATLVAACDDETQQEHNCHAAGLIGYRFREIGLWTCLDRHLFRVTTVVVQAGMVIGLHSHVGPHDRFLLPISIQDNALIMVRASG